MKKLLLSIIAFLSVLGVSYSQEGKSNVQTFTPSKLLAKGQWDVKAFVSLYTQTKGRDGDRNRTRLEKRETFLTNTNEIYTGITNNSRLNVGAIFQIRSFQRGGSNLFDAAGAFRFKNDRRTTRAAFTTIAPSIRFQPFKNVGNFSITTSLFIPIFKDRPTFNGFDDANGSPERTPFLARRSYVSETKFFYDKTFGNDRWQIFTELDLAFNFGEDADNVDIENDNEGERFFNESFSLPISVFLSYFPTTKSTVFVNGQQFYLFDTGNDVNQEFFQAGFGGKYQLTEALNVEVSYNRFITGLNTGIGESFNVGLRVLL